MKIIRRHKVEDCFDGSSVFSYEISEDWTADNIRCLATLGDLEYFAEFPRPLFRLRTRDGLYVSGVTGAAVCRVVLPRTNREVVQHRPEEVLTHD